MSKYIRLGARPLSERIAHEIDLQVFKEIRQSMLPKEEVGMEISIRPCIFGYALIATSWTDRLMAVELGESVEELMKNFINHWNKTSRSSSLFISDRKSDPGLVDNVLIAINDGKVDSKILKNASLSGTSFQRKVWAGLLEIPRGETISYQQLAAQIGEPKATRAIANAVGANPVAIIVPCHRVIRADGNTGGYRWGTDVKNRLLQRERV